MMKLRQKTILIIIITSISLLGTFYSISSAILLESVRSAEHREAEQNIAAFLKLFLYTQRNFSEPFRDWSHWDDSYVFIQNRNQKFIDEQLWLDSLDKLKLDVMLFVKNSGQLVYGIGLGKRELTQESLPGPLREQLTATNEFLHHPNPESIKMGLLQLPENPFWIVSLPVLTTSGKGPIMGSLVVGRYLNDNYWKRIAGVANLPVQVYQVHNLPPKLTKLLLELKAQRTPIHLLNDDTLQGYALLNDILHQPALIFQIEVPRNAYQQGKDSLDYLTISLLISGLVFGIVILFSLEKWVLLRVDSLAKQVKNITQLGDTSLRVQIRGQDEFFMLADTINGMLAASQQAKQEILRLNKRLQADNLRMSAELEVTHRLQQMLLPKPEELLNIPELEVTGFMQPATEVGGDYYDVLQHEGRIILGIGDVTGHGLESGVLMLMVQMAVRTLLTSNITNLKTFLTILNRTVYHNLQRMKCDKNLTLTLLDYQAGRLRVVGQHEVILVIRQGGHLEEVDTIDLGLPIGLEENITNFVDYLDIFLSPGEGIVLYTDGVTEAVNLNQEFYGMERLSTVVRAHWYLSALEIQQAILTDMHQHIGAQKIFDDITIVVLKRKLI